MQFDSDRYELIKHERIEELKSEGYLFRHKLSGARIAVLQNDDENKVFQWASEPLPRTVRAFHIFLNIRFFAAL